MLKEVKTMCKMNKILVCLVLLICLGVEKSQCSPVPFVPSQRNESVPSVLLRNRTQNILEGSSEYDQLIQDQRNRNSSLVGGGGDSLVISNETLWANGTGLCPLHLCPLSFRDKQMRLENIKKYIIDTLGYGRAPSSPMNEIPKQTTTGDLGTGMKSPQTPFSGQIQTFYASCQMPARVDGETWSAPGYFHLYFNFPSSVRSQNGSQSQNGSSADSQESASVETSAPSITTISAKLRLYKMGKGSQTESPKFETPLPSEPCNETLNGGEKVPPSIVVPTSTSGTFSAETLIQVEEKIKVSVYWYTAPITKNHYKKKLLDAKMVSVKESKWIDFDIINAAVPWLDRNEKNYGLVVQVDNEDENVVDPNLYFVNIPCSGNISTGEGMLTPPMVEICTLNTPQPQEPEVEETPSFFPFPMGQSFSYLSRVAHAHATAGNTFTNNNEWQNDGLQVDGTKVTSKPQHKHRHGHGGQKGKRVSGSGASSDFKLDEDHPLRSILATVASKVSRDSTRQHQRNTRQSLRPIPPQQKTESEGGDYSGERDIIIQKIYIR